MEKRDVADYVADMAQQLANLAREHLPSVAIVLDIAAELAREALEKS